MTTVKLKIFVGLLLGGFFGGQLFSYISYSFSFFYVFLCIYYYRKEGGNNWYDRNHRKFSITLQSWKTVKIKRLRKQGRFGGTVVFSCAQSIASDAYFASPPGCFTAFFALWNFLWISSAPLYIYIYFYIHTRPIFSTSCTLALTTGDNKAFFMPILILTTATALTLSIAFFLKNLLIELTPP